MSGLTRRLAVTGIGAAMTLLAVTPVMANAGPASPTGTEFIVKFRDGVAARSDALAANGLRVVGEVSVGAVLVSPTKALDTTTALAALRARGDVEYAEVNGTMHADLTPNDPMYPQQWHYYEAAAGARVDTAWDSGLTGAGVRVAVIDTGRTAHTELNANYLGGYDMISNAAAARDGNARDNNAQDQGDWQAAGECGAGTPARNSSWHGTHVAGTIAALRGNAAGVAGVAPAAKIVPVRVLGRCGGSFADIIDGITWASGGVVAGVPNNPNPARVLNMSLGGSGACPASLQAAITAANNRGSAVVVSAGNSNVNASNATPANCNGVITVAASDRQGNRAVYSNFGATVEITAPGGETSPAASGGVLSTLNAGTTVPAAQSYAFYQGTSMAAPHVAGVVALMQHKKLAAGVALLTPAQVTARLRARAMPGSCVGGCGIGLLDARASVAAA
ncbi:S8 family serine peptidase [Kibdelosporangium phytohabitans]|uniref:S8 family serine peptidase n=1 Tax=Kibdelosporangium phytohabitans TaxID=860235 RepID=UPI0009F9BB90|nr:S8 family serine peptidase [Kibdelosporangium phytohabitans]MBE1462477.1 serine protease [Kibdelosporangium phytohabitans]